MREDAVVATEDEEPTEPAPFAAADLQPFLNAADAFAAELARRVAVRGSGVTQPEPVRPPWRVLHNDAGDLVHIVPTADVMFHGFDEDCVCGPSPQLAPNHEECDHPDVWVHQHHAVDGRDLPYLR